MKCQVTHNGQWSKRVLQCGTKRGVCRHKVPIKCRYNVDEMYDHGSIQANGPRATVQRGKIASIMAEISQESRTKH
eukprot:scaffold15576_cov51-Cyclotella_meneghiniana.AAC.3